MHDAHSDRYMAAVRAGFALSRELNRDTGPVHFLAGIAQGEGPAAEALGITPRMSVRAAAAACAVPDDGSMWRHVQAQQTARAWADSRSEQVQPEHLLVALLDQNAPDVREALQLTGIDAARVRRDVLQAIGVSEALPTLALSAPTPAGTLDRPPLPIDELPADVWGVLCWRQEHLPFRRLRHRRDWGGLYHLECGAVWRLAARAQVNADAKRSLLHHHIGEVERRAFAAAPDIVDIRPKPNSSQPIARHSVAYRRGRRRRPRWLRVPNMFVGWPTWFRNRAVGLNARWFRLTTLHYFRGQPDRRIGHA
ncbi:MAG: Clp protease N-terminal domain-containing protein [Acidimicrobiia bacterium]